MTPQGVGIFARGFALPMVPQRVLLVDDQPAALHFLRSGLLHAWPSCQVDLAGNATQAEPLIRRHRYDAMITDYHLGDGTGLDLARLARRRLPLATIVLTSASPYALADAEIEARECCIGLLPKPIEFSRLLQSLQVDPVVVP
ncbi:MAG: response regulator [Anaerolineae bacterium]|nr:response regulator [Anaerolineae bacterium]